jgi:predicted nucleic acid-binding protein
MSDVVVVDASLAFKWVLAEPDSHSAIILLNQWTDEGMSIIAPAFFRAERYSRLDEDGLLLATSEIRVLRKPSRAGFCCPINPTNLVLWIVY